MWIVDSAGSVVMDTLLFKECMDLEAQNLLTPNSEKTYPQPEWSLTHTNGCYVSSGDLTVVFEIPEFDNTFQNYPQSAYKICFVGDFSKVVSSSGISCCFLSTS